MHLQWDLCITLWVPSGEMGLSMIIMNKGISFLLIYSTQFIGFFKREREIRRIHAENAEGIQIHLSLETFLGQKKT